ncbi:MAG TPA: hypothetical protein VLK32_09025 [Bacillota bacterium]|nr:hypothetical protein [Bacillota bacterium]
MRTYRKEAWLTLICFLLIMLFGGILSVFFVLGRDLFFGPGPAFAARSHVLGFPTHYFLLLILGWFGVTAVGAVYALYMDRLEKEIERGGTA